MQKFKLHIIAECLALHGMITKKKDFHKACYNSNDTKTLNKNVLKVDFEPCGAVYHKIHNKPKKKKNEIYIMCGTRPKVVTADDGYGLWVHSSFHR